MTMTHIGPTVTANTLLTTGSATTQVAPISEHSIIAVQQYHRQKPSLQNSLATPHASLLKEK